MPWLTDEHPTHDELTACVQCGLCLPQCPTFRLTGRETASPRGRLQAMSAVADLVVGVDRAFEDIIDFCLGCRACEPVCPSMVPYGRALEGARAEIVAQRPSFSHRLRAFLLGSVLPSRRMMRWGTRLLAVAQFLGLMRLFPPRYRGLASGLRRLVGRGSATVGHVGGAGDSGVVAVLAGCVQDQWFRSTNRAAIDLLEMAGYRVEVPVAQTCCGALAAHDGKAAEARALAEVNKDAFGGYDLVIATAAGCSAHLREYRQWTAGGDPIEWQGMDITVAVAEAISMGRLPRLPAAGVEVAIQDPCHLRHAQRVVDEPRLILRAAGYEVVEIDPNGMCCGAAGLYTMLQPEASRQLGNQKADQIRSTGVTRVASANPGCEMQIRSVLGGGIQIAHPIEWYLQAIKAAGAGGNVAAVKEPA